MKARFHSLVGMACLSGLLQAQVVVPSAVARGHEHGPTRQAFVAKGCGTGVRFAVTVDGAQARQLFQQGMMQLHGLAWFEAERSFRQVAALEPSCAMAYWGVAMASIANPDRAAHFIAEAVLRREHASPREQRFIDALARFYEVTPETARRRPPPDPTEPYELPKHGFSQSQPVRSQRLLAAWESILAADPDDVEVAALVVRQVWLNSLNGSLSGDERARCVARARGYLDRIFKNSPRHPAHFYRLQFRVFGDARGAVLSVGRAGHYAPAISGHWSSSGRLLASLHRHADAVVYFEAAVRTAHAYLERERAMPFMLPGYAEDAAGYVRCLGNLGRVKDALAWLDYLSDLPRHPRWNRLEDPRSIAGQAVRCFLDLCMEYRLRDQMVRWDRERRFVSLAGGRESMVRHLDVASAYMALGDRARGRQHVQRAEQAVLGASETPEYRRSPRVRTDALVRAGRLDRALAILDKESAAGPDRVGTMVRLLEVLVRAGKKERAKQQLQRLRKVAGSADLDLEFFAGANALAQDLGLARDWRRRRDLQVDWPKDLGPLPHLAGLGPRRWSPPRPFGWSLVDVHGKRVRLQDYRGKPLVLVLYLGFD